MNTKFIFFIIFAAMSMALWAPVRTYAQSRNDKLIEEYTPKIDIEAVVKKAKEYASAQGKNIDNYYVKHADYDSYKKEWSVFFMGNLPVPGNFFEVVVADRSGAMRLMHGE